MKRYILIFSFFTVLISSAIAQDYVTGRITDAVTGQPLQGVSVTSGPDISVLTDSAGCYRVPVSSHDGLLRFTAQGFTPAEVSLRGANKRDVRLYSDAFVSQKSAEGLFTATQHLSVDEAMPARFGSDVRMIGRSDVAGVGANMFVRGYQSLLLGAQPLIVIDGVVQNMESVESVFQGFYTNPLSNLDLNNIQSVQVLKNASSIYGSKGANGALIITTKRGESVSTRVDLDMNWGFRFKPRQMRMLDGAGYRSLASELLRGTAQGATETSQFDGFLNDEPNLALNLSYNTFHNNHDWQGDVFQTGFHQYYGLNVEGGDDVARYALAVSYTMGDGTIKETDYDRLSTHFNADVKLARRLSLDAGLDFTYLSRQLLDQGVNAYTSAPYLSLIKSPLVLPYQYTRDGRNYTSRLSAVDAFGVSNPVSLLDNASVNKYSQYRFSVNIMPRWQITDQLDLSSRLAYTMNSTKEHYFSPIEGISPQRQADGTVWQNSVRDQSVSQGLIFSDTRLHFFRLFGGIHGLDATVGFRVQNNDYRSNYGEGHNTGSDKVVNLSTSLDDKNVSSRKLSVNNAAFYAQANYSYNNKYNLWGAVVTEACNTFGSQADGGLKMLGGVWATFPSVGASWLVSSERFMAGVHGISRLNLRAEYGLTGNDGLDVINRYAYLAPVNYLGVATGLQIANLDNQTQKWETTCKLNLGLDISVLDDRLSLSFDYFRHKTTDLLLMGRADLLSGLENRLYNSGSLQNEGFEVAVDARVLNLRNLKWNTSLGMAHYKNRLTSLPATETQSVADGALLLAEGMPIGTFYGYRTVAGTGGNTVFATEAEAQAANLRTWNEGKSELLAFHAGDVHFDDIDHNGIIDEADRTVIGDANPDLTGSWANHLTYRRFSLDVLFSFSLGGDIYNYQRHTLESMSSLINQTAAVAGRWKHEGQLTDMPRAVYSDPMQNGRFSDRFIEDGSYLKLREVRLSYDLPLPWDFLTGATVWASVSNLYTWTKYLGSDPEVSYGLSPLTQGIDYGVSPMSRSVQFGLKLNL